MSARTRRRGPAGASLHPTPPIGPGGVAVTDTYYFVHRTLTGDGSITVRVSSLSGRIQGGERQLGERRRHGRRAGPVQPWAKAGLILSASHQAGVARTPRSC